MAYYNGTIQQGSKGSDVETWQKFLNTQGYNLTVDGDFGGLTLNATKEWQKKNGLADDGVVGELTWGKAGYKNMNTPTQAPTITNAPKAPVFTAAPDAPTFDAAPELEELTHKSWNDSKQGKYYNDKRSDAEKALNDHGDFNYLNQDWMNQVLSDIQNRKEFSYNLDEDALYQQYKDKYIKQGRLAMEDTIGQASAMTGGYGNSYAQSVGNQAYNAHLENLNEIVPELYQMAYDRYNNETQDLYNQYGLLLEDYARAYGEHSDEYNKLLNMLNRADSEYYNQADMFYSDQDSRNAIKQYNNSNALTLWQEGNNLKQQDWQNNFDLVDAENALKQQNWQNRYNIWDSENTNAWKEAEWDEGLRQHVEQMALDREQFDFQKQQYEDSKKSNIVNNSGGKITIDEDGNYKVVEDKTGTSNEYKIVSKEAAKLKGNNEKLTDYLLGQVEAGKISEEESDALFAEYYTAEETPLKDRVWKAGKDGGTNWLWGIDNNASVKDADGNEYELDKLVDALVAEGMEKKDAKEYVKNLQKKLGL